MLLTSGICAKIDKVPLIVTAYLGDLSFVTTGWLVLRITRRLLFHFSLTTSGLCLSSPLCVATVRPQPQEEYRAWPRDGEAAERAAQAKWSPHRYKGGGYPVRSVQPRVQFYLLYNVPGDFSLYQ